MADWYSKRHRDIQIDRLRIEVYCLTQAKAPKAKIKPVLKELVKWRKYNPDKR